MTELKVAKTAKTSNHGFWVRVRLNLAILSELSEKLPTPCHRNIFTGLYTTIYAIGRRLLYKISTWEIMSRQPENVKTKSNPHPKQPEPSLSTHNPRPSGLMSTFKHKSFGNQKFQPLPPPTGPEPYHLLLDNVLSGEQMKAIDSAGKIIFHTVGDTGNYMSSSDYQHAVADAMEADYNSSVEKPSFFYILEM